MKGNSYNIPTDNDNRSKTMEILIAKLSETNNPFAPNAQFGLAAWTDVYNRHKTLWAVAKDADGQISVLSKTVSQNKVTAKLYQKRLRQQVTVDYPDMYTSILRDFGFQKEKY